MKTITQWLDNMLARAEQAAADDKDALVEIRRRQAVLLMESPDQNGEIHQTAETLRVLEEQDARGR